MAKLGQWALIDIETTGINSLEDEIIDIGFLYFDGIQLMGKYSSLVKCEYPISEFIRKLTGITNEALKNAPHWDKVKHELDVLEDHVLLAHNSDFERAFLDDTIDAVDPDQIYQDSIPYLASLFPGRASLNLESFIVDFGIAEKEVHRGYEDSIDLLKVLLVATKLTKSLHPYGATLGSMYGQYQLPHFWYQNFYQLSADELDEIAQQIDFDIDDHVQYYLQSQISSVDLGQLKKSFSFTFTGENVQKIFRDEDTVKQTLPKYSYRETQEQLALKTGQSFKNDVHALIQAPTGTGKTLGYLVPSALHSLSGEGQQVLIATGTKALQNQAIQKDVPQLRKLLGLGEEEFSVELLVGSGNHLCESLFRKEVQNEDSLFQQNDFEQKFSKLYMDLVFIYNSFAQDERILNRGDLPMALKRKFPSLRELDKQLAVDFRSCTGQKCPFKGSCGYIKGLRKAKDANIIIGNHALMLHWPRGFARPEYIVVDEAHKLEEEATSAYTIAFNQQDLESLQKAMAHNTGIGALYYLLAQFEDTDGSSTEVITKIRNDVKNQAEILAEHLEKLPELTESLFKKIPRYTSLYWNELPMIFKEDLGDTLRTSIFNHLDSIKFVLEGLYTRLTPYIEDFAQREIKEDDQVTALTRFEAFYVQVEDLYIALNTNLNKDEEYSQVIRFHEDYGYSYESIPVDIGKFLYDGLLKDTSSVVFTSATLANSDGTKGTRGIEWSTGYNYVPSEKRFKSGLYLPATFDYKKNTRVFLCDDTLPLYDHQFVPQIVSSITPLIYDLQGRTLLLFSSRVRFEGARELLIKEFEGKIPLFIQGMGNNVVEEFKKSSQGILLGMESFGEGIDIPGDSLQFIFIDKVPDVRQDLIIKNRRDFYAKHFGNEFVDYFLANRTRKLHQKLGRLLRTENDHGGIIVVESRIRRWKNRTIDDFNALMEPYEVERLPLKDACDEVWEFIQSGPSQ